MNDSLKTCPKCQQELVKASIEQTPVCSFCGFKLRSGADSNSTPSSGYKGSAKLFWIALLTPATGVLVMLALMKVGASGDMLFSTIAFPAFFFSIWSSAYCGHWLAVRLCRDGFLRGLAMLFFGVAIFAVNFTIVWTGCSVVS